jgi:hypothetical protein
MKNSGSGGISLMGALFILFLALKLCGVIGWSWWWVFAPLWGPPLAVIAVVVLFIVCLFLGGCRK